MNPLNKLTELKIANKEKFQNIFSDIVKKVQDNKFLISIGEKEYSDHYIVIEGNRLNSYFIHIVPKEAYNLFKELQNELPNKFLGFSVLAGRLDNRDVRISCFGVDCINLGKALIKRG